MESKSLVLSLVMVWVLLVGLFLEQDSVEAKSCCKDLAGRICYNVLRKTGKSRESCAARCSCIIIRGKRCPEEYPRLNDFLNTDEVGVEEEQTYTILEAETYATNDFASWVVHPLCSNIITLQNSIGRASELEEVVQETLERCYTAYFHLCNKKSSTTVVAANPTNKDMPSN